MMNKSRYIRILSLIGLSMSIIIAGIAMLLSFPFGAEGAHTEVEAEHVDKLVTSPDERCLADDPYQLDELTAFIESDTPSSELVEINRFVKVQYIGDANLDGKVDTSDFQVTDEITETVEAPVEPSFEETRLGTLEMIAFNTRTKHQFRVTIEEDALRAVHTCRENAGLTQASDPVEDTNHAEEGYRTFLPTILSANDTPTTTQFRAVQGRSKGIDTRTNKSPSKNRYPWKVIANLGRHVNDEGEPRHAGCTGTMIGPRHMVTAAHCLNKFGTNNFRGATVVPARMGVDAPFGTATATENAIYFIHSGWVNGETPAKQWDWALVILPANPFPTLNQWMGYAALTGNALTNYHVFNRGYPTCRQPNPTHPANCQIGHLYGDSHTCKLSEYHLPGPDGWNRNIRHTCDTSAGQSGSPLYLYLSRGTSTPSFVPAVIGTHIGTGICDADLDNSGLIDEDELCTEENVNVNVFRRHTPIDLTVMSIFREAFQ